MKAAILSAFAGGRRINYIELKREENRENREGEGIMMRFFSRRKKQEFGFSAENSEVQELRRQVEELNVFCRQLQNENDRLKRLLSSIQELVLPK